MSHLRRWEEAWADLMGYTKRRAPGESLRSRCSLCGVPSVTNQKGYQRCEVCWDLDQDQVNLELSL